MTDRLSLYNGALSAMGTRQLASLTEDREPRYKLDDIWDRNFVDTCLEQGQWGFATRSQELSFSPSVSPAPFGYENGFDKPDDWIRTTAVCQDPYFKWPLLHYSTEAQYWWADLSTIYVSFVSNDSEFGLNFANWPKNFTRFAEFQLAQMAGPTIMGASFDMSNINAGVTEWLKRAKATDAMEDPAKFQPPNSWVRSRWNRGSDDRGSRSRLIG